MRKNIMSIFVVCLFICGCFMCFGSNAKADTTENSSTPPGGNTPTNNSCIGASQTPLSVSPPTDYGQYCSNYWNPLNNYIYVCYYDYSYQRLLYAWKDTNSLWHTCGTVGAPFIVDSGNVGTYCSFSMDMGGHPVLTYYDAAHDHLKLALWTFSASSPPYYFYWQLSTLTSDSGGRFTSIKMDSSSIAHISYYNENYQSLMYVTWSESSKNFGSPSTVNPSGTQVTGWNSIGIDSSGNPRFSYYDSTPGQNPHCMFAYLQGLVWYKNINVDSSSTNVGRFNSLAVDSSVTPNRIHISYNDMANNRLKYAFGVLSGASTAFTTTPVDSVNGGASTSIILDSMHRPQISFVNYYTTVGELCYAYLNDLAYWVTTPIVTNSQIQPLYTSIALATSGTFEGSLYINYYDGISKTLKDVNRTQNGFTTQTVQSSTTSSNNFIALDNPAYAMGRDHFSFWENSGNPKDLMFVIPNIYSHKVDTESGISKTPLVIDSNGNTHIAYECTVQGVNEIVHAYNDNSNNWYFDNPPLGGYSLIDSSPIAIAVGGDNYIYIAFITQDSYNWEYIICCYWNPTTHAWAEINNHYIDCRPSPYIYTSLSIAVDSSNAVNLAYFDKYLGAVRWTICDRAGDPVQYYYMDQVGNQYVIYCPVSITTVGYQVYIAYNPQAPYDPSGAYAYIKFVECSVTNPIISNVDTTTSNYLILCDCGLKVDSLHRAHIAYYDFGTSANKKLMYAYSQLPLSGYPTWYLYRITENVNGGPSNNYGQYAALALDNACGVHIVFFDNNKVIRRYSDMWAMMTVPP